MENYIFYSVIFGLFLILLASGLPIAFALGFVSILGITWLMGPGALFQIALQAAHYGSSWIFLMIPLFILMGETVSAAGLGDSTYTALQRWLYRLPGSLATSSVAASAGFAAVSGSSPVTAATIGAIAIPEMLRRGYDRRLAVGSVAAGGTLGILIPPSLSMVIYGVIAEQSVGKLFIAGIVPGIVLAAMLAFYITIAAVLNPSLAPRVPKVSWRERFASLSGAWVVVVLAIIILGSIYTGIATPTEAAGVGASVALLYAFAARKTGWASLYKALTRTVTTTSMVVFLVIGGTSLAFVLSAARLPQQTLVFLNSLDLSPWIVLIAINVIYLILGCFLDPMSVMVITLPTFIPLVAEMGFDLIWFGVIVTINIEIGMITPPVGLNLYILKAVLPELSLDDIILGSLPFVVVLLAGLAIALIFPQLSLWLPATMG